MKLFICLFIHSAGQGSSLDTSGHRADTVLVFIFLCSTERRQSRAGHNPLTKSWGVCKCHEENKQGRIVKSWGWALRGGDICLKTDGLDVAAKGIATAERAQQSTWWRGLSQWSEEQEEGV